MSAVSSEPPADKRFPIGAVAGILVVLAIYFGSQFFGQTLITLGGSLAGFSGGQIRAAFKDSAVAQFGYILTVEVITLTLLFLFMRGQKIGRQAIGLFKPRLRDFGVTLLAYPPYFIMNAGAVLAATYVFHINSGQTQHTGFETAKSTPDLIFTFISLVLLPPIVEEIVMRGFLFSSIKRDLPIVPAALLTSVIFALAHLQFGNGVPLLWVAAIDTFILSLVLCYLRQRTGSLWPGIGLHMLKNLIAFSALFIVPNLPFIL